MPITADSVGNDDEEGKVAAVSMPAIMQEARPVFVSGNLPPRGSAGHISHQTAGTPPAVPLITAAKPDEDTARADEESPPKIIQVPITLPVPMASATPTMSTAPKLMGGMDQGLLVGMDHILRSICSNLFHTCSILVPHPAILHICSILVPYPAPWGVWIGVRGG